LPVQDMWSTTFERFSAETVPLLGVVRVAVTDWTRPRSGPSRIFDREWMERLTCTRPWMLIALYVPMSAALLWWGVRQGVDVRSLVAWYLAGVVVWSLVEYLIHRCVFHRAPTTHRQVAIGYVTHGVHHAYPEDPRRLVLPIVVTLPVGTALLVLDVLILGRSAYPFFSGFMHAYLLYDLVHAAIHRGTLDTALGRSLRRYHLQHHYARPGRRFGVSSPLWDVIFRTGG